jgi:UDP-glucose:(glucosyl)LPS alpha-1,2-glucosyltransferase
MGPKTDGTYPGAKGGTELMKEGLVQRLPADLLNNFQIICSRVRDLEEKKRILWLHDTFDDPENQHLSDPKNWENFSKMVFVSYHQFQNYHLAYGIPYDKSIVMKNAIDPIPFIEKPNPKDQINLIYHTTPHRGLELLIPTFVFLAKKYPKIHLDVYSSFKIYGWEHRDEPYQKLFDICKSHPQITYHGTQSNQTVREALQKAHIFAFPSIWPETSCIAVIEAMSAGAAVVCSDLAALPETTGGNAIMYRYNEDAQKHVDDFAYALEGTILRMEARQLDAALQYAKNWTDQIYGWDRRALQWESLLRSL